VPRNYSLAANPRTLRTPLLYRLTDILWRVALKTEQYRWSTSPKIEQWADLLGIHGLSTINILAFSPDGAVLASGDRGRSI
jgi:hypothetical protein